MPNQPAPGSRGHYISSIPDPLWERAQTVAAERGESVSAVVRRALEEYVGVVGAEGCSRVWHIPQIGPPELWVPPIV